MAAVGRGPRAVGRALDHLAKWPQPVGGVVRFFSSLWLGLLWLFLTAMYIAVGSGFASLRARLEMTDMQFFNSWPMVVLMALLALTLSVVTVRRIPLTLYKLGPWTVHVGILVLLAGCFIYFSQKHEGLVRIFLNRTENTYYDNTERALYVQRVDPANSNAPLGKQAMAALPELPYFYEHLSREAYPQGKDNPLNMTVPSETMAQADAAFQGVTVRVVGYYPDADMNGRFVAGAAPADGKSANPAVLVALEEPRDAEMKNRRPLLDRMLVGQIPRQRIMDDEDAPLGLEYLHHPTREKQADVTATFNGPLGMTVRVPKLGVERVYSIEPGKAITVEGTPYVLTPGEISAMPMRSAGYEGAMSSMIAIQVVRHDAKGDFRFERQAMFRFPERSPDWIDGPNGQRKRVQDRVDQDLQISFHDARKDQFWIVEQEDGTLSLVHRTAEGAVTKQAMEVGRPAAMTTASGRLALTVAEQIAHAIQMPRVIPPRFREPARDAASVMANSMVAIEVSRGEWEQRYLYAPFVQFANGQGPAVIEPTLVDVPGVGRLAMLFSTVRRPLPAAVTLKQFDVVKRPGALRSISDWISTVEIAPAGGGSAVKQQVSLNHPTKDQGLVYYQSGWSGREDAPPEEQFTILGVGNRPGTGMMTAGAMLMIAGILYAFYVAPLLLKRRKERLAAYASGGAVQEAA